MKTETDDLNDEITKSLDRIRRVQADALAELENTQIQWQALLEWEAYRIEAKLGPEHPRTLSLKDRLQSNRQQIRALAVERERQQIRVPEVTKRDGLVHGRVTDPNGRGIRGLVVRLVDREGVPLQDARAPTTDGSGYFAIVLRGKTFDKPNRQQKGEVFLGVFADRCRLLYRHCEPLELSPGVRLEKQIRLSRDELEAGTPLD